MDDAALRGIARQTLEPGWTVAGMLANVEPEQIHRSLEVCDKALMPLNATDANLKGEAAKAIDTALRPIGAKIAPHLSPAQASAWRDAMLLALSDLPGRIALQAVRKAVHVPMQFLADVEGIVRKTATELVEKQRLALWRLKTMLEEIERAANPAQPQLEAPPEQSEPMTFEEARSCSPFLLGVGLRNGFVTQEVFDRVQAERDAAAGIQTFAILIRSMIEAERMAREPAESAA